MFILAPLKISVWGKNAQPSRLLAGGCRGGRAATADEDFARPGPAARSTAALRPSVWPPAPRLASLQRARAGEGGGGSAHGVTKPSWNARIRAELRRAPGTHLRPALTGREAQMPPPFPLFPSLHPADTPQPPVGAAASQQPRRRKASWESRAGRTRGRSAAARL